VLYSYGVLALESPGVASAMLNTVRRWKAKQGRSFRSIQKFLEEFLARGTYRGGTSSSASDLAAGGS